MRMNSESGSALLYITFYYCEFYETVFIYVFSTLKKDIASSYLNPDIQTEMFLSVTSTNDFFYDEQLSILSPTFDQNFGFTNILFTD